MYKILKKEVMNQAVIMMEVEAPYVAARCEAGQFVIVRLGEDGERIPLTIADFDREKNSVTIIFQVVGYSTEQYAKLEAGMDPTIVMHAAGHHNLAETTKYAIKANKDELATIAAYSPSFL